MTVRSEKDRLAEYARLFRHLPRTVAAELVAEVASDPDLQGRKTVIAQAAVLVSAGHRLGWIHDETQQAGEGR